MEVFELVHTCYCLKYLTINIIHDPFYFVLRGKSISQNLIDGEFSVGMLKLLKFFTGDGFVEALSFVNVNIAVFNFINQALY